MNEERVRLEVSDHVAAVTLARPEKHNALDPAMFEAIVEAAERVAATPGVRAVVLHGDGPSFCSGIDVASAFSPDAVRGAKRLFDESWDRPAEETLALEAEIQLKLIGSPNQLAAIAAGMTKQPPAFVDPG